MASYVRIDFGYKSLVFGDLRLSHNPKINPLDQGAIYFEMIKMRVIANFYTTNGICSAYPNKLTI